MQLSFYRWLWLLGWLFTATSAAQAIEYTFISLEVDFPSRHEDLFGCTATGINDFGLVVGGCNDLHRNGEFRAFSYNGRRFSEIKFQKAKVPAPKAHNSQEPLHTWAGASVYQSRPFQAVGKTGQKISLSKRPIVSGITPQDINNQGRVTGWFFDGSRLRGFVKRNGKVFMVAVPESLLTEAIGINDVGQIVGDYRDEDGFFHGFIYENGAYTTIDVPFISSPDTGALGINNLGEVVGCYSLCSRGFRYDSEALIFTQIDVPGAVLTQATDINDAGQIVGIYSMDGVTVQGFLHDEGGFTSIDVPGSIVTSLSGINNAGQIVGHYLIEDDAGDFEQRAFVATPVAE